MSFADDLADNLAELRSWDLEHPIDWMQLGDILTGSTGRDDGPVSQSQAMKISVAFGCYRVIAESVGMLPCKLFRRLARGKESARDHPYYRLVHDRPNPEMTAQQFWELMTGHCAAWGGGFAEMELSRDGEVLALWPLLPHRTRAVRVEGKKGIRTEIPEKGSWKTVTLPMKKVLHIPGIGYDGLNGYPMLTLAAMAIRRCMHIGKHMNRLYHAGTQPDMVFSHPSTLSGEAKKKLRAGYAEWVKGLTEDQRLLILEEGMKLEHVGLSPTDSMLIQSAEISARDVLRFFRMTPKKLGFYEGTSSYKSLEEEEQAFRGDVVQPWVTRLEKSATLALFPTDPRRRNDDPHYVEFSIDALARSSLSARAQYYANALQNGWLNRDDVRELEGWNPIPDDGGEVYTAQINLAPLDYLAKLDPASRAIVQPGSTSRDAMARGVPPGQEPLRLAAPDAEQRALRSIEARRRHRVSFLPLFERLSSTIGYREGKKLRQLISRAWEKDDPLSVLEGLLDDYYAGEFAGTVARGLQPILASFAEVIRGEIVAEVGDLAGEVELGGFLVAYATSCDRRHVGRSRALLRRVIERDLPSDELKAALLAEVEGWEEKRPMRFGRRETVRAEGAVSVELYAGSGVTLKRCRSYGSSCGVCTRLDGKVVGIRESFIADGEVLEGENGEGNTITAHGPMGHPPWHDYCDCGVSAA